jgi:hypothetical protein
MKDLFFPRTSQNRGDKGFARMLTSVDLHSPPGLQFKGSLIVPGTPCEVGDLPRPAVLLECAGSVRISEGRSRYCFRHLWVLWKFDFETPGWVEVIRTTSDSAAWTVDFAPIAWRLLNQNADVAARLVELNARPVTERLVAFLQMEFESLTWDVCCNVLAGLDQFLANEIILRTRPAEVVRNAIGEVAKPAGGWAN